MKSKSKSTSKKIKTKLSQVNHLILPFFASSSFLASIYYCFFNFKFYREHRATLKGIIAYKSSLTNINHSCVLLRRNIHRLEKGLIMKPRKNVFADNYITETVNSYLLICNKQSFCGDEKKWATDVLTEYFNVVGSSKNIDTAREKFTATLQEVQIPTSIPYKHEELAECAVSYDQLNALFKRRRSIRWFNDKKVEMSNIRKAVNAAVLAPSACNRQPFQFFVLNEPEKAVEVAKIAMGTAGFAENIPCLVAIVGSLDAYEQERDRHVIYIDGSLASMQFMLALETLGLSSCAINWPDIESREKKINKKLKLQFHERVIMLMAVGYAKADGSIPFSQKKSDTLMIREI